MENYLYHYTSIDTLDKILTNKTFCFTTLALVDDLDEVETADISKFGRFCYVSCWTREEKESIPMWKMYTPDMQGVRIRMREFPFKKYTIQSGQQANENTIETYINAVDRCSKNLPYILPLYPQLIEVDYTERDELLYPQIRYENNTSTTETVVEDGKKKTTTKTSTTIRYETKYIGLFKRKCWAFQAEWRYRIFMSPYTYQELAACKSTNDVMQLSQRIDTNEYIPEEQRIFLELDETAIQDMEILVGPRATKEQLAKVLEIARRCGIDDSKVKTSSLRIR